MLGGDNQTGSLLEHRIQVIHVHICGSASCILHWRTRQTERAGIALLAGYEVADALNLGCVHEGALYAHGVVSGQEEHVALTHQLVCSRTVEDSAGVNHGAHLECHSGWEVGLDRAGDDVRSRALSGDNHVNTYGTSQLSDAGYGQLNLLTGSHNQIAELINDDHDIRHKVMSVFGVQLAVAELLVVFLQVAGAGFLQQVVAVVHLYAEALQRVHHFLYVGDNRLVVLVLDLCQEVIDYRRIDAELHLLRVNHHQLQLCRVLLI